MTGNAFPSCVQLWRGAVLTTIAHAVWTAPDDDPIEFVRWHGDLYLVNDWEGTLGAVAFAGSHGEHLVGAFNDSHSPRQPGYRRRHALPPCDLEAYFAGLPDDLRALLERLLSYDPDNADRDAPPVVTAAFWSKDGRLTAAEPWSSVVEHGAHAVGAEVEQDDDAAMQRLRKGLHLSPAQSTLAFALFERRMAAEDEPVLVKPWERAQLTARGKSGIETTREALAAVGIVLP